MAKSLEILRQEGAEAYADPRILILLDGLLSSRTFTFSGSTLTTATAHNLVVDSRIRFTTTGTLPAGIVANTDYFVKTVPLATTLTIAETIGGTAITLSGGTGAFTLVEQQLSAEDSIAVLVNHEVDHPNYARRTIDLSTWTIDTVTNQAVCLRFETFMPVSPNGALTYRHIMLVRNGSLTLGDTTGDRHELETEAADQVIAQGGSKNINVNKRKANP